MGKTILFVYGTLKRGGRGHRWIARQRFLREATTSPKFRLYDLGSYPGLVRDTTNGLSVAGELWEVDETCLSELDDFEYAPELYVRDAVEVEGMSDRVESYIYNKAIPAGARSGKIWPFPATGG